MLKAENITVRYGEHTVVDHLSFHLEEEQWLMLAGPNGAGKSTLIETISQGVPYTGSIQLDGRDIRRFRPTQLARRIGVLAQKNTVGYAYTVEEFQKQMSGIYTTTANEGSLDECPMAYKAPERILEFLSDSVEVEQIAKPIYNFKAC